TVVAEVARREDVSRALAGASEPHPAQGVGDQSPETELAPNLYWTSVDPQVALEEYLIDQLPMRGLAELLLSSRLFSYLAAATPGLRELVTVGKLWELAQDQRRTRGAQPYDLVIVDAPATGHALALLQAPRTFADVARVGPIHRQATIIHRTLTDPALSGVLAVATPSEMPVSETLSLQRSLSEQMGLALDRVVVNEVLSQRFSVEDVRTLTDAVNPADDPSRASATDRSAAAAVQAAISSHHRAREQRRQIARLRRATGVTPASLPFLFCSELAAEEVGVLADRLERVL
ncbi:MAG TPA: ArsA-related P-loop ATPase, partial [Solirubrobacteraceae bacterium]|nr:ArsA-related P-loop ATPase [Solirubrobacteraceae bacterium]